VNRLIGKYVQSSIYPQVFGTIVFVIKAGTILSHEQMLEYARIDKDHKCYKSVRGPCRSDRVVLSKPNGHYWITPLYLVL